MDQTARIEALEVRLSYQDRMIADLNDVITAQWKQIEAINRELARLRDEQQALFADMDNAPEPPPPHY